MTETGFEVYLPFGKVDQQPDGTLLVHTVANDETVDDEGEIVTFEAVQKASPAFLEWGAVREMHNADKASGTVVSWTPNEVARTHEAILHVVDPVAVAKVLAKVYKGTSLGGFKRRLVLSKVDGKPVTKVTEIDLREISLADRPRRGSAKLTLIKSSDLSVPGEVEIVDETEDVAAPGSGSATDSAGIDVYLGEDGQPMAKADTEPGADGPPEGGKEREDIPAADFAGKGQSYPIVTPASVGKAAAAIGRAGPSNFSAAELKARIIAIAKRKGASFVAALPKSWQPAFEGAAPPFDKKAEKASGIGDLRKAATDDVEDAGQALSLAQAVLGCINELLAGEAEEGDADDVAFLREAQQAMIEATKGIVAFVESESSEVGTPDDIAEEKDDDAEDAGLTMTMAYSAVIGDLAKAAKNARRHILAKAGARNNAEDQSRLNQIHDLSVAAGATNCGPMEKTMEKPEGSEGYPDAAADTGDPSAPFLQASKSEPLTGSTDAALLAKVSAAVGEALAPLVRRDELEAMQEALGGTLAGVREELRKVAAQPLSGGPLRYAPSDGRFGSEGGDLADALRKVSESFPIGSPERERLGQAAARTGIRALIEQH